MLLCNRSKKTIIAAVILLLLTAAMPMVSFGSVSQDLLEGVQKPKQTDTENVKEGLVEIQTGFVSDSKFYQVRKCNGFLISNSENGVYIVTTSHGVSASEKDRKNSGAGENATASVRVLVRGDVASELSELTSSKKQDFCVLQSSDVVKTKGCVTLSTTGALEDGEKVSAMGFPSEGSDGSPLQYDAKDIKTTDGEAVGTFDLDGVPFIQHTCEIDKSMDGSVLTDENGFVVGMNNASKGEDNENYALSAEEVEKVLDNYGVPYATEQTEAAYAQLYARCEEGKKQSNQSRYKEESKQRLDAELEKSVAVMQESPYDLKKLTEADARLQKAQGQLKTKIPKTIWAIVILGLAIVYLLIRFIKLYRWRKQHADELAEAEPAEKSKKKRGKRAEKQPAQRQDEVIDDNEPEPTIIDRGEPSPRAEIAELQKTLALYWERMDQRIIIDKPEYVIGKKKEMVDFAVEDNGKVSRVHASIRRTKEGYRIIDLKSSNGTYVNEQQIPVEGVLLHDGDLLRFADEQFVVEIK